MIKKYFPYIALAIAAALLLYIKSHQNSGSRNTNPKNKITVVPNRNVNANINEDFNRHTEKLVFTKHALCRMDCRHIDESEVKEILEEGTVNYSKIEKVNRGKTYPLEGVTHDKQHVRIVFAPKQEKIVVVTVIDLDKDWYCNCK